MKVDNKNKLYRKENTKAFGVFHIFGSDYSKDRAKNKQSFYTVSSMHGKKQRGLDYTPLFKFLLSHVGDNWDKVYSEAKSRLDKEEPIFWIVALHNSDKKDYVRIGENSYYSGLFVDVDNILQKVNPEFNPNTICFNTDDTCTFNGTIVHRR